MRLDEFNRWASPLQNNISRVVAENLVALLGTPRVTLFPQTLSADADYRVAIEVQRFESAPGEAATLDAVWTVRRTKDGKSQTGRTTVREAASDKSYDALAAAHSRAARAPEPGHRRRRAGARAFHPVVDQKCGETAVVSLIRVVSDFASEFSIFGSALPAIGPKSNIQSCRFTLETVRDVQLF